MSRGDAVMRAVRVREVRVAAAAIEEVAEVSVEIAAVAEAEEARAVRAPAHDDFVAIVDGKSSWPSRLRIAPLSVLMRMVISASGSTRTGDSDAGCADTGLMIISAVVGGSTGPPAGEVVGRAAGGGGDDDAVAAKGEKFPPLTDTLAARCGRGRHG